MKAAFASWNQRIAPVFDVARRIHLVQADNGRIVKESEASLQSDQPALVARQLAEWGIETLVCGAISHSLHCFIVAHGIEVIPFRSGDLHAVIAAWLSGELAKRDQYLMPGCGRHGCRQRGGSLFHHQEVVVFGRKRSGQGPGDGSRRGGGERGGGHGRTGGSQAAGPDGECVCPSCGHREPHQRGVPCTERNCPQCHAPMTRA